MNCLKVRKVGLGGGVEEGREGLHTQRPRATQIDPIQLSVLVHNPLWLLRKSLLSEPQFPPRSILRIGARERFPLSWLLHFLVPVWMGPCSVTSVMPHSLLRHDCNPPGSSVHEISQARILVWAAIPFSRESSWSRDWTCLSCTDRQILYHWATWEAPCS